MINQVEIFLSMTYMLLIHCLLSFSSQECDNIDAKANSTIILLALFDAKLNDLSSLFVFQKVQERKLYIYKADMNFSAP